MSYFKNINLEQNVAHVSTLNSSTDVINANTTWTGDWEEVTNQSAIQWVGKWTREVIFILEQGTNGVDPVISDSFTYLRDIGFSGSAVSAAPYYRVSVQNTSLASNAVGEITTAATTVFNPLPRTLSCCGGLESTICGLADHRDFEIDASPNHELLSVVPFRLCGSQFGAAKDGNFWVEATANSASVTVSNGIATLNTNVTAPNGSASYTTFRNARYVAGSANRFRSQVTMSAAATNNSRKVGPFDGTNGAYFELDGAILYAVTLKGGSPTRVASTSFSNSRILPDLTKNVTYEIYYNNSNVWFLLNGEMMHVISASTATWTNEISIKARLSTTNSANEQGNHTIIARNCAIHRLGAERTEAIYKNINGGVANQVLKVGPGRLHRVLINTPGTLCILYDNAIPDTSNRIASIDCNKTTGLGNYFNFEIPFFNGLSVVTTGASDVTVCYE